MLMIMCSAVVRYFKNQHQIDVIYVKILLFHQIIAQLGLNVQINAHTFRFSMT